MADVDLGDIKFTYNKKALTQNNYYYHVIGYTGGINKVFLQIGNEDVEEEHYEISMSYEEAEKLIQMLQKSLKGEADGEVN